ncbi:MAG: hypothetical protein GX221_09010 [Candidatus Riflebacteria bacterium]|nr:hypothetical protein [Candidatus Riflebacteria bacterium]
MSVFAAATLLLLLSPNLKEPSQCTFYPAVIHAESVSPLSPGKPSDIVFYFIQHGKLVESMDFKAVFTFTCKDGKQVIQEKHSHFLSNYALKATAEPPEDAVSCLVELYSPKDQKSFSRELKVSTDLLLGVAPPHMPFFYLSPLKFELAVFDPHDLVLKSDEVIVSSLSRDEEILLANEHLSGGEELIESVFVIKQEKASEKINFKAVWQNQTKTFHIRLFKINPSMLKSSYNEFFYPLEAKNISENKYLKKLEKSHSMVKVSIAKEFSSKAGFLELWQNRKLINLIALDGSESYRLSFGARNKSLPFFVKIAIYEEDKIHFERESIYYETPDSENPVTKLLYRIAQLKSPVIGKSCAELFLNSCLAN